MRLIVLFIIAIISPRFATHTLKRLIILIGFIILGLSILTHKSDVLSQTGVMNSSDYFENDVYCKKQYPRTGHPVIPKSFEDKTQALCASGYALLHSGLSKGPLWVAEALTSQRVVKAKETIRNSSFFADSRLKIGVRGELSDYARSGYDRGHMAPSGDMEDEESQKESFTLANIVPQNADSNRHLWADIERTTRNLANRRGLLYVVTGPVYNGDNVLSIGSGVLVPSYLYKAVYDPKTQEAAVWYAPNAPGRNYRVISVQELMNLSGISVFPNAVITKQMILPAPVPYRGYLNDN